MGNWFDARLTPDGWRFRRWNSIVDCYTTPPLAESDARDVMTESYTGLELRTGIATRDIDERIARAKVNGTTALPAAYQQDIHGPWETERCGECSGFHHAFDRRPEDGLCAWCGEPASDRSHGPVCVKDGGGDA